MTHDTGTLLERQIRETLRELILEIVGLEDETELTFDDDRLLGYDFGLASIEFVALLEQLHERLGISLESITADARSAADVLDRVNVRWVIDRGMQAVTNGYQKPLVRPAVRD